MLPCNETYTPERVLDLWFPEDGHWTSPERHQAFWQTRMYGGMDEVICRDFAGLTRAAAAGELDHWAGRRGGGSRCSSRSTSFRGRCGATRPRPMRRTARRRGLRWKASGTATLAKLRPWEQAFFVIALGHCEGPDHLDRLDLIDRITEEIVAAMPPEIAAMGDRFRAQNVRVRAVIERFGRHPHRNPIYGRVSSAEEEAYIAHGRFPACAEGGGGESRRAEMHPCICREDLRGLPEVSPVSAMIPASSFA